MCHCTRFMFKAGSCTFNCSSCLTTRESQHTSQLTRPLGSGTGSPHPAMCYPTARAAGHSAPKSLIHPSVREVTWVPEQHFSCCDRANHLLQAPQGILKEAKASVFLLPYNNMMKAIGASCPAVWYWVNTMFCWQKMDPQLALTSRASPPRILKFYSLQPPYITGSDLSQHWVGKSPFILSAPKSLLIQLQ